MVRAVVEKVAKEYGDMPLTEAFQYESVTASFWCWGDTYSYSPPPVSDLSFSIQMGCLLPL
jgi:hypothetical protein